MLICYVARKEKAPGSVKVQGFSYTLLLNDDDCSIIIYHDLYYSFWVNKSITVPNLLYICRFSLDNIFFSFFITNKIKRKIIKKYIFNFRNY